jgi:hypothetical protein
VAPLSQGRTAAEQCGLFTHKSVPVIFEPPCISKENTVISSSPAIRVTNIILAIIAALLTSLAVLLIFGVKKVSTAIRFTNYVQKE